MFVYIYIYKYDSQYRIRYVPLFNVKWQFLNPIKEFHSAASSY